MGKVVGENWLVSVYYEDTYRVNKSHASSPAVATVTWKESAKEDPTIIGCSTGNDQLTVEYPTIHYYSSQITCGSLVMKQDIAVEPKLRFHAATDGKFYTLMYTSVDSHIDRSWPDNTIEGVVHIHWMVGNLTAQMLTSSNNISADGALMTKLWPHHGPGATQRYAFILMEHDSPTPQASAVTGDPNCLEQDFCSYAQWSMWIKAFANWKVVGGNWLVSVYYDDAYRTNNSNANSGGHGATVLI